MLDSMSQMSLPQSESSSVQGTVVKNPMMRQVAPGRPKSSQGMLPLDGAPRAGNWKNRGTYSFKKFGLLKFGSVKNYVSVPIPQAHLKLKPCPFAYNRRRPLNDIIPSGWQLCRAWVLGSNCCGVAGTMRT